MAGKTHGPTAYRDVLRELREGRAAPAALVEAADRIPDHGFAARALVAIATHGPARSVAADALRRAVRRIRAEQNDVRLAEAVAEVLKRLPREEAYRPIRTAFLERLIESPDSEALSAGLREAAKWASLAERVRLFARARKNAAHARDDAKAVLRAAFQSADDLPQATGWLERIEQVDEVDLRVRLAAFLHHEVARIDPAHPVAVEALDVAANGLRVVSKESLEEATERFRAVVQAVASPALLDLVAAALEPHPSVVRADVLLALGAQADKLGDAERAEKAFAAVATWVPALEGRDADRVSRKLETARARLGGASPAPRPQHTKSERPAAEVRPAPRHRSRHALALYNTYSGALKPVHLRSIARAAPLCLAFELDLVLVGFGSDLDALVTRLGQETRIGGDDPIARLAREGRIRLLDGAPDGFAQAIRGDGVWVATTERPHGGRSVDLVEAAREGPLALVMGVGPKGLPERIRRACAAEYEITGQGIGLETATAMGILADRLGRLDPPSR